MSVPWFADLEEGLDALGRLSHTIRDGERSLAARAAYDDLRGEIEGAHQALDDFDVPATEPHFRSPFRLSGRIRSLRSSLVIEANQRAGKLMDTLADAETRAAALEAGLRRIAEEPPDRGLTPDFRQFARDALESTNSQERT